MTLQEQIKNKITEAMKSGDKAERDTLRYVYSLILAKSKNTGKECTDADVIDIIKKEIKSIEDNLNIASKSGTDISNLSFESGYKIGLLTRFLPKQISEEELKVRVKEIFAQNSFANMGAAMSVVLGELSTVADKKLIAKAVKECM